MTLTVPLTVRIGDRSITTEVSGVGFRKEAIGGVQSITLRLARPLDRFDIDLAAYSRVYIYDARTTETIAEGRLSDTGRSASSGEGQQWDMTAFGPAQHASDKTVPLVYVDQSLTDGWRQVNRVVKGATFSQSTKPNSTSDSAAECQVFQFPNGTALATNDEVTARYERIRECAMKLGSFGFDWDAGVTNADYSIKGIPLTDGTTGSAAFSATFNTAGGTGVSKVVVTDFSNGRNTLDTSIRYTGAGATPASDAFWGAFSLLWIRSLLLDSSGTEITGAGGGYANGYVFAYQVVGDLLGRVLDQFDGANASIATTSYQIDQLVYYDGATAAQVFDDLMLLEPAYRWTTGPSNSAGLYSFSWEAWPTSVRYEVTLDDGGTFPTSAQELYNSVLVRRRDKRGRVRSTIRTGTCPILDNAGIDRQAMIDIGDEAASSSNASRVGDNFLAEHQYPANAGTLTVNRPIMDLELGRMVLPHEIEPGELIRVRGVESYTDALNASSKDGLTVFRIWSSSYNSDSDSVSLELDTYSRTTANALARLARRRNRRR